MSNFLIIILLFFFPIMAKDLGSFGTTFEIEEEDILTLLIERLERAKNDENKKLEIQKQFVKTIENPKGKIFPPAKTLATYEYDPTICLNEDIRDTDGKIVVQKGTKINPLDNNSLRQPLIFFDGHNKKQLLWAKSQDGIWILTNGNPLDVEKLENRQVYFDQAGYLTKKLGIQSLPAKVYQKANKLQIEEIPCL